LKKFVLTDVHGFYSLMIETLKKAGFFSESEPPHLIVLGDLLDRGNEAVKMVEFMKGLKDEGRLTYVRGNHEDLFVACLQEVSQGEVFNIASPYSHHFTNGTWDSMLQLAEMDKEMALRYPRELVARVMHTDYYRELLPMTVDYVETQNHIFVHGYIPAKETGRTPHKWYTYDPNWRDADYDAWRAARWYNGMSLCTAYGVREPGKTIVCGHYHASYGHSFLRNRCSEWGRDAIFEPYYDEGIIAMDASTANSDRMNCLVFEEGEL